MVRSALSILILGVLGVLVGCGGAPPKAQVRGTITLDKKPLANGDIVFVTPGKAPESLPITNGNYEGMVEIGDKKVEILAYKDAPAPPPMEGVTFEPSKMNYLPPRYNTDTQLTAKVTTAGPNEFKFDLTSNP